MAEEDIYTGTMAEEDIYAGTMAEEDNNTKDGTVDYRGRPAKKKTTGTWRACPYILGNECCERLAYYGMGTNLVNYLTKRLNQGNATASTNVNNWSGTCYITPLLGAFIADAYLGRFWTIATFSSIYVFGLVLLTMSASVHGLKPTCDSSGVCHATMGQSVACFAGLYLIALGTGGIKPCTPLFRNQKPAGSPLTRLCQVLVASLMKFRVVVPTDKSLLYEPADDKFVAKGSRKLDHTDMLIFFDKAAVETEEDHIKDLVNPWRLCSVTQVEELKSIIRLLPIWATGIVFSTVYSQMNTLFVLQGDTMDLHMGPHFQIPSASLSIFDTISVLMWVPIYDQIIVPFARKFSGHKFGFTQLQRMGIGLFISIFSMAAAAVLELLRLRMVRRHNYYELSHVPMSVFWQIPQYFLVGCAEVFINIGQLEFFYDQAPDSMRSMCTALALTTTALGNFVSTLLVNIVTSITTKNGKAGWIPDNLNYGHIDYFYLLLAIMSVVNLGIFILVSRWYTYKKPVGEFPSNTLWRRIPFSGYCANQEYQVSYQDKHNKQYGKF
ncbi:hypothetical protein NE237_005363 [Protea cynaroides]|uniref:Peptide transporter 1 n=1 Tax=Protea cynaroides TaxID=273540 RepID=A0A9Q0KL66_9MAGN|nr:hypothetical protein NE237_005363 [Protea cynaroides]